MANMLHSRQLTGTHVTAPHRLTRPQPVRRLLCRAGSSHHIAVLPGDGIGPEITKVALQALTAAGRAEGASFSYEEAHIGGAAIDATGKPLPEETLRVCKASDAVLLAAIGGCAHRRDGLRGRHNASCEAPLRDDSWLTRKGLTFDLAIRQGFPPGPSCCCHCLIAPTRAAVPAWHLQPNLSALLTRCSNLLAVWNCDMTFGLSNVA